MGRHALSLILTALFALGAINSQSGPPRLAGQPSILNSTYIVDESTTSATVVTLREEDGQLVIEQKLKSAKGGLSLTVAYDKIVFVGVMLDSFTNTKARQRTVQIRVPEKFPVLIATRSESEATELAAYIGRKSSLDLIGTAWRVRKQFDCPTGAMPGCSSFKEMLDHNDTEIVNFFYRDDRPSNVFGCFSEEFPIFFIIVYTHFDNVNAGFFQQQKFDDGQSSDSHVAVLDWSGGHSAFITMSKSGSKLQYLGTIDQSSLSYETEFTNKIQTTTNYKLSIRWSTGRYKETLSYKDEKGKSQYVEMSGTCSKFN
jgi:hypothetical protein